MSVSKPRVQFLARLVPQNPNLSNLVPASPLFSYGEFGSIVQSESLLSNVSGLLQDMYDLTVLVMSEPHLSRCPEYWKINQRLTEQETYQIEQSEDVSIGDPFVEACQIGAYIYRRALQSPPVPFSSPSNHKLVRRLYECMIRVDATRYSARYPGILLWLSLIGAASSIHYLERAVWATYNGVSGLYSAYVSFNEFRKGYMTFLCVQRRAEGVEPEHIDGFSNSNILSKEGGLLAEWVEAVNHKGLLALPS
jgi:hypothetical protein